MKKLFYLFAVVAVVASLASCNKKDEPALASFNIVVSDVDGTSANVKVTPSDPNGYYLFGIYDAATLTEYKAQDIVDALKNEVGMYIIYGIITFEDLVDYGYVYKGEGEGKVEGLDPETEYAAIALYLDTTFHAVGDWSYKTFKTGKVEIVDHKDLVMTGEYDDEIAKEGWYQIMAYNADSSLYISLSPDPVDSLTQHITLADLDAEWSYLVANGETKYSLIAADYTAALNGDVLTVTGKIAAANGVEYNLTATCAPKASDEGATAPAKKLAPKNAIVRKAFKK